jgi:circadian clock protein KaiB
MLVLRLYVAGDSPNSVVARASLKAAIRHLSGQQVTVEIIDVLQNPERALRDCVLVTPTLVKVSPGAERRAVGSLTDREALLTLLGTRANDGD